MDSKKDILNQNILFNDNSKFKTTEITISLNMSCKKCTFIQFKSTFLKILVNFDLSSTWDLYNFL